MIVIIKLILVLGSDWVFDRCKIGFQVWRFKRVKEQETNRIHFNWDFVEFWYCHSDRYGSPWIDKELIN